MPEGLRKQEGGGAFDPEESDGLLAKQTISCDLAFHVYDELIEKGVSRELARAHLPQCTFTEFYWKIDLHNLLHFLALRMDDHAQKEIRDLAYKIYDLIKTIVPVTCEAFEDFRLGSLTLSRLEVAHVRDIIRDPMSAKWRTIPGKGENQEFQEKLKVLGL